MKDCKILENSNLFKEDIKTVSYYLVSLYYKTGCKYHCYRTKLNRLLTIYKLCATRYNNDCLDSSFVLNETWIGFPELAALFFREVYMKLPWEASIEDNKEIQDKFDDKVEFNKEYKDSEKVLSLYTKQLIEIIFRKFGNYTIGDLAHLIDEIKQKIPVTKIDNGYKIDTKNYEDFLNINLDNEIFKFIKNFKLSENKKSVKEKVYKKNKSF